MKSSIISFPKLFLLILLSTSFISSYTQTLDEFPEDSAKYIETLEDYLQKRIKEKNEALLDTFISKWNTGQFLPEKRDSIVVLSNLLLKNRGKREPHFTHMMNLFIELNETSFDSLYFDTWMKGFRSIMNRKKGELSAFNDYIKFTLGFAKEKALYLSNTRSWYSTSNNLDFVFDSTLKIKYSQTSLKCKFREDSIQIFKTSGTFYPFTKKWEGQKGLVTWERAGYEKDEIYVNLKKYQINMKKASYAADSVEFVNKLYFNEPILGKLEDELVHIIKPSQAIYPVFKSYKKIFRINDIYENINYTGGFTMKGARFIGSGGKNKDAVINVFRDEKKFMTAKSKVFILSKRRAISRKASVTIHLGQDSIYHTGLQFNYNVKSREIELGPNESVLSESVYYDTYHQISMKIDRLLWNTAKDSIYFTHSRNSQIGEATFTSMNFFTLNKWLEMEMRDRKHPLIAIRNYYWENDSSRKFDVKEYAKHIKKPIYQVRHRLFPLAKDGFIFFDFDEDTITINDKLFNFISSRIGKIDYDVINLNSTVEAPDHNGVLDLKTMDLTIRGVPEVHVSDSQNVIIVPKGRKIVMKKNRYFDFGGGVISGLFTFFGDDFSFDYERFKISLHKIDSLKMKFQTEEMNMYGKAVLANVKNTIEELSGDIYIDKPDNKSGKENYPKYPVFESNQKSFVYYNELFNGPYKKENFYFELAPFKMDSLDNFNPENLRFDGNFRSANIFPPFKETLRLREDNSLGFSRQTPEEGFPLYEGKGKYFNTIDMSNRGLKGEGILHYLTAKASTEDILFFPDSTSIHATEFTIDQKTTGIEYPELASKAVNIKWYPHEDRMNIEQTGKPFEMFNEDTHLAGNLKLKPTGLTGQGIIDLSKAILESQSFKFKSRAFNADTANFKLKTIDSADIAFKTDTVNARIDFDYQRGRFETVKDYAIADFPQNLYESYLNKFVWKMDEDELDIESSPVKTATKDEKVNKLEKLKDGKLPGALYLSKHREQDSLRFSSPNSTFKLRDNTINAHKVEYIHVADARIYPFEKNLTVAEQGNMKLLEKAEIIADTTKKFHRFFDAGIKVKGRNNYVGEGNYHYIDKNDKKQVIHFNKINVDNTLHTQAEGKITEPDSFTLSPHFGYRGDVFLKSQRQNLEYKGGVKMFHNCQLIPQRFASFESVLDPDSIYIPVGKKNKDIKGNNIYVGPFITIDTTHIYPTLLTQRKDASDNPIVSANGYLHYNENEAKYKIASKAKLDDPDTLGPLISLNKNLCWYHAEGKMDLGVDYGHFKINPVGRLDHQLDENKINVSLTLPLEFPYSDDALDTMRSDIKARKNLDPINLDSRHYKKNLNELYGEEVTSNYLNQQILFGKEAKIPKELEKPKILFSNINFEWCTSTDSYIAQNDFSIAMINGKPVNRQVNGFIEIAKKTYGDRIYIYLKLDEERFYYFNYFRGMLRTHSNNKDFIKAIDDIPKRKRTIRKGFLGNVEYRYILSTSTSFSRFMKHYREVKQILQDKEKRSEAEEKEKKSKENQKGEEKEKENKDEKSKEPNQEKNSENKNP